MYIVPSGALTISSGCLNNDWAAAASLKPSIPILVLLILSCLTLSSSESQPPANVSTVIEPSLALTIRRTTAFPFSVT